MSLKVQNPRLELVINPIQEDKQFATFVDDKTIDYTNYESIIPSLQVREYSKGLNLSKKENNIIINSGAFYDEVTQKLYNFDKPTILSYQPENIYNYEFNENEKYTPNVTYNGAIQIDENYNLYSFSSANYAYIPFIIPFSTDPWELHTEFVTGATVANNTIVGTFRNVMLIIRLYNGQFRVWMSGNNSSWNIIDGKIGISTILPNTKYYINFKFTGTEYILESSTDNIDYVQELTVTSSTPVYNGTIAFGLYGNASGSIETATIFNGSINMANSYIKMNNEYIWRGLLPTYYYKVYYDFDNKQFIYSQLQPTNRCKYIGYFNVDGTTITTIFPQYDFVKTFNNHYIIDEYIGTIGYRIYSDGWKEQWGNNVNPTFPIAFDDIPLSITVGASNVTKTGMTIAAGFWAVEGY